MKIDIYDISENLTNLIKIVGESKFLEIEKNVYSLVIEYGVSVNYIKDF
ncbi:hypothetical protein [Romboutsia hominis]|nr:hypothetical protein [Romboutsia hominis]MCH1960114.1 hypothetical protein [Romboutsia hominis]MCH1969455.1 hypothetical protein [Romboutsia hominis]